MSVCICVDPKAMRRLLRQYQRLAFWLHNPQRSQRLLVVATDCHTMLAWVDRCVSVCVCASVCVEQSQKGMCVTVCERARVRLQLRERRREYTHVLAATKRQRRAGTEMWSCTWPSRLSRVEPRRSRPATPFSSGSNAMNKPCLSPRRCGSVYSVHGMMELARRRTTGLLLSQMRKDA